MIRDFYLYFRKMVNTVNAFTNHIAIKKNKLVFFFLLSRTPYAHRKSALSLPRDISEDRDGKLQYKTSIDWSKSKIFFSIHV